jgi:hypothetical protein
MGLEFPSRRKNWMKELLSDKFVSPVKVILNLERESVPKIVSDEL